MMAAIQDIQKELAEIHGENLSFEDLETMLGSDESSDRIEIIIDEDDHVSLEDLLHGTEEPPAIRLANVIMYSYGTDFTYSRCPHVSRIHCGSACGASLLSQK